MKPGVRAFLPLAIFLLLVAALVARLVWIAEGHAPNQIASVRIGKPVPAFSLQNLFHKKDKITTAVFKHKITVVNFFASWCLPCHVEHPLLDAFQTANIQVLGMAYKDTPAGLRQYLRERGNPYDHVAMDADGRTAIDFGTSGVPETYVVDASGIIRYKHTGPLTPQVIRHEIIPIIRELRS